MSKNVLQEVKRNTQLCWECEKAGGRCSWSRNFTPVKGWKATPSKVLAYTSNGSGKRKSYYIDSFNIVECPEFELMEAIKRKVVYRSEFKKESDQETIKEISRLRNSGKTVEQIANIVGFSERQVYRILKKIKEVLNERL